jgi:hypothetical protein
MCLWYSYNTYYSQLHGDNGLFLSVYLCICVFTCVCGSKMMDVCGEAESRLASVLMQHEVQLERDILEPLNQLAEVTTNTLHILPWH